MNDDAFVVYFAVSPQSIRPFLKIPVTHAAIFTSKPLKWVRYAAAAVLGAEGGLSTLDRLALDLENTQPDSRHFLYTPTDSIRFIDIDGLNHLKSSQFTTESRTGFQDEVRARDEQKCVISDHAPVLCEAMHLIPHSKGSSYMQALCRWRTGVDEPEIETITDIRNGVYVNKFIHSFFTVGQMAILMTPNFAMTRGDVLPALNVAQERIPFHFTPHYFVPENEAAHRNMFPRDCRYPPVDWEQAWPRDWPPRFLWDFIYGVIISRKYGIEEEIDAFNQECNRQYYPEGIKTATQRAEAEMAQRKRQHDEKVKENNEARDARAASRGQRQLMDSYDRVFCSWMQHRFGPLGQKTRAQDEARLLEVEQKRQQSKANDIARWQEGVTKADTKLQANPSRLSDPGHRSKSTMS